MLLQIKMIHFSDIEMFREILFIDVVMARVEEMI